MIEQTISALQEYLIPLGAAGVFAAAFLEEVVAPIPSAAVMMAAGFFFLEGSWTAGMLGALLFKVALPISLGVTIGSLFIYYIAYFAGKPAILKWGKWLGVSWKEIEAAEQRFSKGAKDELLVLALRTVPIVPSAAIAGFCGLVRMNVRTYAIYTFIGTFARACILGLVGWQVGNVYGRYADVIGRYEDWVLYVIAASVLGFIAWRILAGRTRKSATVNDLH